MSRSMSPSFRVTFLASDHARGSDSGSDGAMRMLLMDHVEEPDEKVVYFMTMDNVKFRKPVVPGDTLVFGTQCEFHEEAGV